MPTDPNQRPQLEAKKVVELRAELSKLELPTTGRKSELVDRLLEAMEKSAVDDIKEEQVESAEPPTVPIVDDIKEQQQKSPVAETHVLSTANTPNSLRRRSKRSSPKVKVATKVSTESPEVSVPAEPPAIVDPIVQQPLPPSLTEAAAEMEADPKIEEPLKEIVEPPVELPIKRKGTL